MGNRILDTWKQEKCFVSDENNPINPMQQNHPLEWMAFGLGRLRVNTSGVK